MLPLRGFDPETPPKLVRTGADIIDVCSLGMAEHPLAAAGLGMECSIHLVRDAFTDRKVKTIRLPGIQDRAYRVLSAEGHVFLLTHRRLYALVNLATMFLEGMTGDTLPLEVRSFDIDAVDIGLNTNRTLVVIEPSRILEVDIETLVGCQGGKTSSHRAETAEDEEAWSDIPASWWTWKRAAQAEVCFVAIAS